MIDHAFYKPLLSAAFAFAGDRAFLANTNMRSSAMFGAAVGAGVLAADAIASKALARTEFKTLETRVMEAGLGTASALAIDRFVTNQGVFRTDMANRVGVILGAEILGDYTKRIVLNEM